tara:strand:+ start:200 stop:373 length:174 start_codon:yes stop_codon:yes gene_type:complete
MDTFKAIDIIEGVYSDLDDHEEIEAWQHLIDTGVVWHLQGHFGRTADDLIQQGVCTN